MKEYLIVGGGIDALMTAWMIKKNQQDAEITIKTKNADPRIYSSQQLHGSTWAGLSYRHVTYLEGYNRNRLEKNDIILQNTISNGGWLGKNFKQFSTEECKWLARRISTQHFTDFNQRLFTFFKDYNSSAIAIWHDLIKDEPHLFHNVDINYNMASSSQEFYVQVTTLGINILNYLESDGVKIQFNQEVKLPQDYQNIIVMVGAYGYDILKNTAVKHRLCAVAGSWLTAESKKFHSSFHICTDDLWEQNYTYLGDNQYIVSGGYALAGFDYRDLCPTQQEALIKKNAEVAERYCNNINSFHQLCFRGFTDNDLPLFSIETRENNQKVIVVGGMNTGTTTAAPLTGRIISNLLMDRSDGWKKKLDALDSQWNQEIGCQHQIYNHYYKCLMKQYALMD